MKGKGKESKGRREKEKGIQISGSASVQSGKRAGTTKYGKHAWNVAGRADVASPSKKADQRITEYTDEQLLSH